MSFDFGSLNNNKKKTSTTKKTSASKSPSKSSSRTSSSKSSSSRSTRRSRSRNSNPLSSLFKGKNKNLYTYGSLIGGFLILLIIAVFCFSGGSSDPQAPKMDKRAYHDQAYEYTNKGEFEKAIAAYKKAYELDPNDSYATDQISILYRNELHDERSAEFWKSKSEQITANKVDSSRGASAEAYKQRAERLKKKHEAQNRR